MTTEPKPDYPNARDCPHGSLRRSCERCEDAARIAALEAQLAEKTAWAKGFGHEWKEKILEREEWKSRAESAEAALAAAKRDLENKEFAVQQKTCVECQREAETENRDLEKKLAGALVQVAIRERAVQRRSDIIDMNNKLLAAARAENGHLKERLQSARDELMEHEEEEGSRCPEDIGFMEYTDALEKQLAKAREELKLQYDKGFAAGYKQSSDDAVAIVKS